MNEFVFKLYITGQTPKSERAIANIRLLCERELPGQYKLTIIDVLEQPHLAEDEKILATPTLIKESPPPLSRVIGDLSDTEKVLMALDLQPYTLHSRNKEATKDEHKYENTASG